MKVKKSEIQLLIAVIGVLIAVATYFLVYTQFNDMSDTLESQNTSLRSQIATLEVLDQRKEDYLAATEKMQNYIVNFENRFPADILPEDSIMMIKTMEESTDTEIANISFGTEAEVAYAAQGDANTSALANATADAPADTAAAAADAAVSGTDTTTIATNNGPVSTEGTAYADTHMYEVPLGISIECTYNGFKGLVRYIYGQRERQSIQGVSISYNEETGILSGSMNLNTYYLLGTDKTYSSPDISGVGLGVDTIFGNVD